MKIIQLINSLYRGGGAEKFLCELALAQSKIPNVEVKVVNLMKAQNPDFIDVCKNAGIEVFNIDRSKYSFSTLRKLKKYVEQEKPDLVHVHLFPALYYAAFVKLCSTHSFKLVYTEHSTKNRRRGNKVFKVIDSFIYSRYDKVFAISKQVADEVSKHVPNLNPIIINNGIDLDNIAAISPFDIKKYLNLSNDAFVLTMVARFYDIKDYSTIIKALKLLPDNVHFVCVGDGPTLEKNRVLAKDLQLSDRVHFLGLRKDVYAILKGSDVVVLSTHHEGFSISMLEAMGCGKPFIASAVPGIKDLVADTAVLFEYKNENHFSIVLKNILFDRSLYQKLADKSLSFVNKYDIKHIADEYVKECNKQ